MKVNDLFKFIAVIVSLGFIVTTIIIFLSGDVQEVCVPLHVKLNPELYKVYREDTIHNADFPLKRVYYTERNKK